MIRILLICFCGWMLSGCLSGGYQTPETLHQATVQAGAFPISTWRSKTLKSSPGPLTIIIEGDGRAFTRSGRIGRNPTPHHPLAPQLAAQIPGAIALARPCQFEGKKTTICHDAKYWTSHRWAPEVIHAYDTAITTLKQAESANDIHLIGFSGGAAVALLVAAKRDDITRITTLAGNLDTDGINRFHNVTPTPQSLNPRDIAGQIATIPQRHIIGSQDPIIPAQTTRAFIAAQGAGHCASLRRLPIGHNARDWARSWPSISRIPFPC